MLQFISHHNSRYGYIEGIRMALEGGCRWVQLRMKEAYEATFLSTAQEAVALCRSYHARLILDDRVEMVKRVGADGVHLGRKDMPADEARTLLGPDLIIGGTANTIDDVRRLHRQGVDYIGCGPYRFTTTKQRLAPVLGLEGYRAIVEAMRRENILLPVVAIGGITRADLLPVLQTGVSGVAISGGILDAEQPAEETKAILSILEQSEQQ